MITKEKLIGAIQNLPDELSIEDVLDELIMIQKIETGLSQSKNNEVISNDDLTSKLPKWLT